MCLYIHVNINRGPRIDPDDNVLSLSFFKLGKYYAYAGPIRSNVLMLLIRQPKLHLKCHLVHQNT